jgi:hypothetical protein
LRSSTAWFELGGLVCTLLSLCKRMAVLHCVRVAIELPTRASLKHASPPDDHLRTLQLPDTHGAITKQRYTFEVLRFACAAASDLDLSEAKRTLPCSFSHILCSGHFNRFTLQKKIHTILSPCTPYSSLQYSTRRYNVIKVERHRILHQSDLAQADRSFLA